ncbi:MAG: hypothetical protein QOK16_3309 [Solirubrobacteraceae bacterium]|nr:hypothetical protein [Solirubrobacteraceae bacterium]
MIDARAPAAAARIQDGARELGARLSPATLVLDGGARVDVDGADVDRTTSVETFARQGRLKAGQYKKVAWDALKLITIAQARPDAVLALGFASQEAADCVTGKSWLSEALRAWGIKVIVVDLDQAVRDSILLAQARQIMVNPDTAPPAS